ncbi:MAG: hypothetical protein LBM95_07200 [Lactobacillales bacterium]|jgi:hypothetical protein|nr:hypothetical protein [Lactobacillales bacterium]
MGVVTEEVLRQLFRKHQLSDKGILGLKPEDILTPSAQSFISEHRLVICEEKEENRNDSNSLDVSLAEFEGVQKRVTQRVENQMLHDLLLELARLENEFAYLASKTVKESMEICLYAEQQEKYCRQFATCLKDKKAEVICLTKMSCPKQIGSLYFYHYRSIELFIETILDELALLISNEEEINRRPHLVLYEQFEEWSMQFVKEGEEKTWKI